MASSIHGLNKRNLIFLVIAVIIASAILHGRNLPVKPIAILPPRTVTYTVSSGDAVTIFFGGDTMLGDAAMSLISKKGYSEPLSKVSYITSSADVAIVNLEAPVTTRGKPISAEKARLFRQHPYALTALANAGIDIFMLANNHILDYGPEGLMDTLKGIEQHKLAGSGAGFKEQEARRGIVMQYEAAGGEKRRFCCGMPVTVHIDVMRRAIKTVEFIPVLTNNYVVRFIPRRPDTGEAYAVLEQLRRDSNINNRNFEVIHAADGPRGRIAF